MNRFELTDKIKVSIISANRNNGRYLIEFLNSIENSTYLPSEVIVIDDYSTDNSLDILKGYKGKLNLICYFSKNHLGFPNALNKAVNIANGNYLLRIDPDDIIHETRIETQIKFLCSNKEIDLAGSNVYYFKENYLLPVFKSHAPVNSTEIINSLRNGDIPLIHSSIIGKKEIFERFPYKSFQNPVEDYHFFSTLVKHKIKIANLPEYLTYVRIHPNSVSQKLQFARTRNIFELREEIFGKKSSLFQLWLNYLHLKFYRYFLTSDNILKWLWLCMAAALRPAKILNRLCRK